MSEGESMVFNREAMAAISRRRQPADSLAPDFLSREAPAARDLMLTHLSAAAARLTTWCWSPSVS